MATITFSKATTPTNSNKKVQNVSVDGTSYDTIDNALRTSVSADLGKIATDLTSVNNEAVYLQEYSSGNGVKQMQWGLYDYHRANRLSFLPADQIIVEQTTDGGTTWTDAGYTDTTKQLVFSSRSGGFSIPLKDGVISTSCGIRITITAMKYNVPSGTKETEKYNYWNSSYIKSQERYCSLNDISFYVSTMENRLSVKYEIAKGNDSNTWSTLFDSNAKKWEGLNGWSGYSTIRISTGNTTFGGSTTQITNYWNHRITLFTAPPKFGGDLVLSDSYKSTQLKVYDIRGYGQCAWATSNNMMFLDHMYSWDASKNVTFPAKVTSSSFSGDGSALTNISYSNLTNKPTIVSLSTTATDTTNQIYTLKVTKS